MTNVLVTGAGGFIGHAVAETLLKIPDVTVHAVSLDPSDRLAELARSSNRLFITTGVDLGSAESLKAIPGGMTYAVHAAGLAQFQGKSSAALHQANVRATEHLIDHLRATSPNLKRLLFTSTIGVHDRPKLSRIRNPIEETSPLAPTSAYGKSKIEAEKIISESGLPHAIVRLSWIYGPHMRPDSHIRQLASMCHRDSFVTRIPFPGRVTVAYIDDVAAAIVSLLMKEILSSTVFLIGHETPVSFDEVFSIVYRLMGKVRRTTIPQNLLRSLSILTPALPMKVRCLLEDYYVCRLDRLKAEGIGLRTSLESGLRECLAKGQWF